MNLSGDKITCIYFTINAQYTKIIFENKIHKLIIFIMDTDFHY